MSLIELERPRPREKESTPPEPWPLPRKFAAILLGLWLLSGVYIVAADQQAVVTRFGKVVEPRVAPGIHLSLPWPIDRVVKLKAQQLRRLVIGGDVADVLVGRSDPAASQFLTGDQNLIHMRVVVQYSVGVPADYLFRAVDVARAVAAAVEAELAHRVANRGVDAVLTTEKALIQEDVRGAAQKLMDDYGVGVALASVNIESVVPPPEASDAFRDVAGARADSARIVNQALGYANDLIPRARGEAQQLREAAEAYRLRKINQAQGDAARFTQVAAEYAKASDVNGHRLYVEAMEQVLPKIRKLIIDKSGNLDLTIIRRGAGEE
ncbi:MAG: FtsH protease activity modulator HflK [Bryobacteraceae bacterium]|nr:FtsH protease activity modulator HflK [Bryobacteraceae bacterium]